MQYKVRLLDISRLTHDVKRLVVEKPKYFTFSPGQAVDISIDSPKLKDEKRPFTITNLNDDDNLEFIIKGYYERNGVTKKIHDLVEGAGMIISEPFGTIKYQKEGVFIAGGAGITPFIAILRLLRKEKKLGSNKLLLSNKNAKDIILESEIKDMYKIYPQNLILTLTKEKRENYENGRINKNILKEHISDFSTHFYLCGPKQFVEDIKSYLLELGAKSRFLIFEK